MGSSYFKMFKSLFLFTTLIGAVTGCGSGGSTANSDTGSIAAKLTWSSSEAKTAAKTVSLTPPGVTNVRLTVSGAGISPDGIIANFPATAGVAGSGTINGIPAGTGRTIKAEGMDSNGFIRFQGIVTDITVVAGTVADAGVITMTAPATTATPAGGVHSYPLAVNLTTVTTREPATIYYTTNGSEPTTLSTNGVSPFDIQLLAPGTLRFFAIDAGFAREALRTVIYN